MKNRKKYIGKTWVKNREKWEKLKNKLNKNFEKKLAEN